MSSQVIPCLYLDGIVGKKTLDIQEVNIVVYVVAYIFKVQKRGWSSVGTSIVPTPILGWCLLVLTSQVNTSPYTSTSKAELIWSNTYDLTVLFV